MSDLEKRMQDIYNRVWQEAMPNVYGSRYTPIKGTEDEIVGPGASRYKKEALFIPHGTDIYRLD